MLQVGQLLKVPNCRPRLAPTAKPSKAPAPAPVATYRLRRPSSPPSTDDTLSSIVQGAKKILDGVQAGVNSYKVSFCYEFFSRPSPSPHPTQKPHATKFTLRAP